MFAKLHAPKDSLMLELPWGDTRSFLVPASDPYNPRFDTKPRNASRKQDQEISWADMRYEISADFLDSSPEMNAEAMDRLVQFQKLESQRLLNVMMTGMVKNLATSSRSAPEIAAKAEETATKLGIWRPKMS